MKPSAVVYDFETSGLRFWEPDFRVLSCAFSWFDVEGKVKSRYLEGEAEVGAQLRFIADAGIPLICHNASFEQGVTKHRYPWFPLDLIKFDTMRMVQVKDNGGRDGLKDGPLSLEDELALAMGELHVKSGLSLVSSASRHLPRQFHDHKAPYYRWLRENGVKKGQEGANLHLLPDDMIEAYNVADTIVTLMLYDVLEKDFKEIGYNWHYDHELHIRASLRIADAKARGVPVDRERLQGSILALEGEAASIEAGFMEAHRDLIAKVEAKWFETWANALKTERGRARRLAEGPQVKFDPSNRFHLRDLFIGELGIKPIFHTKEGKKAREKRAKNPDLPPYEPKPSFKAAHLASYGPGGEMLKTFKGRLLVKVQANKLAELSAADGRWHLDLKACGTTTGRYAGGGGLNAQGLARRDKGLMGCLVANPGHTFVSIDLAAGEPTVIAHYSKDKLYNAATFGMVGKQPYWDGSLLMIDSPYYMFGSISPIGKEGVKRAWEEGKFEGWVSKTDSERKKAWGGLGIHKTISLAKIYGQGARGTVNFAADQGLHLDFGTSKILHNQFWYDLFPAVRVLGERLEMQFKRQGYLYNQFGYRLTPSRPSLCLNHTIQSSVSGVIKIYDEMLQALAPYARWVTVLHDEQIWEVPDERLDDFKAAKELATQQLNDFLGWSVDIRTGWVTGKNLYDAK